MSRAIVALGGNLGDRYDSLRSALFSLEALPYTKVIGVSSIYDTAPFETDDKERFLNAAVMLNTDLSPHALLGVCLGIEASMGRVRTKKNGARIIDLDLLLYDEITINDEELTLPHPEITRRAFVLAPLRDLLPDGKWFSLDLREFFSKLDEIMSANGVEKSDAAFEYEIYF